MLILCSLLLLLPLVSSAATRYTPNFIQVTAFPTSSSLAVDPERMDDAVQRLTETIFVHWSAHVGSEEEETRRRLANVQNGVEGKWKKKGRWFRAKL